MKLPAWTLLLKPLHHMLSGRGSKSRFPILIYHRVVPSSDALQPWEPDADTFDWHMKLMARHFRVMTLGQAISHLRAGTLPRRAACITFDDGYADNAEIALPILKKYGVPATFFIATDFIDNGIMWNDIVIESIRQFPGDLLDLGCLNLGQYDVSSKELRQQTLCILLPKIKYLPTAKRQSYVDQIAILTKAEPPNNLMLSSDQVKELYSAGMEIGGHTVHHPILACIDKEAAYHEILGGKIWLENLLGDSVRTFAYPNGKPGTDYLKVHAAMVKALGFDAAVSTVVGGASVKSDLWQLPRFTPWDKSPSRFLLRLIRVCYLNGSTI